MRKGLVAIEAVATAAALGFGFWWALPAAALGIAASLILVIVSIGAVLDLGVGLVRLLLQPGASEDELAERLLPRWATTVWTAAVACACIGVAQQVEDGVLGDPHGLTFLPLMLPWFVLGMTLWFRVHAESGHRYLPPP